jgi:hypothetical protein
MMRMNLGEMFGEISQHWKYALLCSINLGNGKELEEDQVGRRRRPGEPFFGRLRPFAE